MNKYLEKIAGKLGSTQDYTPSKGSFFHSNPQYSEYSKSGVDKDKLPKMVDAEYSHKGKAVKGKVNLVPLQEYRVGLISAALKKGDKKGVSKAENMNWNELAQSFVDSSKR